MAFRSTPYFLAMADKLSPFFTSMYVIPFNEPSFSYSYFFPLVDGTEIPPVVGRGFPPPPPPVPVQSSSFKQRLANACRAGIESSPACRFGLSYPHVKASVS